jgi:TonB family protein
MSSDELQSAKSENKDNYEAAVLDFLDREMAAVQSEQKPKEQSEELDALVSDLLKQVMMESDQPAKSQKAAPDALADVLSEFPPQEEEALPPASTVAKPAVESPPPVTDLPKKDDAIKPLTEKPQERQLSEGPQEHPTGSTSAPSFASIKASKSRTPLIAAASVLLLFIAGGGAFYYYSGSSKSVSNAGISVDSAGPNQGLAAAALPMGGNEAEQGKDTKPQKRRSAPVQSGLNPSSQARNSGPSDSAAAPAAAASRSLVPAVPISQVSPSFPESAVQSGASGSVILDLRIDEKGTVVEATPVSGPAVFYGAAVDAVKQWRYKPASIGDKNVSSQSRVTMVFNMKK